MIIRGLAKVTPPGSGNVSGRFEHVKCVGTVNIDSTLPWQDSGHTRLFVQDRHPRQNTSPHNKTRNFFPSTPPDYSVSSTVDVRRIRSEEPFSSRTRNHSVPSAHALTDRPVWFIHTFPAARWWCMYQAVLDPLQDQPQPHLRSAQGVPIAWDRRSAKQAGLSQFLNEAC